MEKQKKRLTILLILFLGIFALISCILLVAVIVSPEISHYVKWLMPILNMIVVGFMIFSREVIIGDNWKKLAYLIRFSWWVVLIYNMYQAVTNTFALF